MVVMERRRSDRPSAIAMADGVVAHTHTETMLACRAVALVVTGVCSPGVCV